MLYYLYFGELPQGIERECMSNQFDYMESLDLFNNATLFGETCAFRDELTANIMYVYSSSIFHAFLIDNVAIRKSQTRKRHLKPKRRTAD